MASTIEGNRGEETYTISADRRSEDGEIDKDSPAVFLCGRCRLPFGDSLFWAGSDDETNQILLRKTNDNVVIAKDPFVSCTSKEKGCLAVKLTCAGCSFSLGLMYISTPKALDYKRSLFCFNVENIERSVTTELLGKPRVHCWTENNLITKYIQLAELCEKCPVLTDQQDQKRTSMNCTAPGSSGQQVAEIDSEETPLTLECKETLKHQMTEIKSLAVTIGQRLLEVEINLQPEK